jgi:hypothetical protein
LAITLSQLDQVIDGQPATTQGNLNFYGRTKDGWRVLAWVYGDWNDVFLVKPEPVEGLRTWTATSGETVEAALVKFDDGLVYLRLPGGNIASVPLEKLSKQDQAYVAGQAERDR